VGSKPSLRRGPLRAVPRTGDYRAVIALVVLACLAVVVVIGGVLAFRSYMAQHRREAEALLNAVGDLKVGELVQWRRERLGDAAALQRNPVVVSLVQRALASPPDEQAAEELTHWLHVVLEAYSYDRVMLLDPRGIVRLVASGSVGPTPHHLEQDASVLFHQREPFFIDFHRDGEEGPVFLAVAAPILASDGGSVSPVALVVLRIDPTKYLYPLIRRWPAPSRTAETLLVRREGQDVVYLNELRLRTGTALQFRRPLSERSLPAAMAALGQVGVVDGIDYRGKPVRAALRQIPGSNWALVARMDIEEIDAPVHGRLAILAALVGALLALLGAIGGLLWRQQRTRHYHAIFEAERKFRTLFESMAEGVVLHELVRDGSGKAVDYRVLGCNPASERHTGIAVDRARGALGSELYGIDKAPYLDTYTRVAETGEPVAFDAYFPPLRRHFSISVVSPSPGQFATVFEDITERKQREEELRQKTEEMERFTYTISHDLKSPLVTVQTFLGYLQDDLRADNHERVRLDIGYISAAAERMGRLLDELLRMSRLGRVVNPPTRVAFQELVQGVVSAVAGRIAERGVQVDVSDTPLMLCGDRPRLEEIWQNLLDNAVKFMGDQPRPRVEVGSETGPDGTVFFVRDNGRGIDPRHQGRVFGLFERLDARGDGTGLGLALAKRVVELYGGRIWVESTGTGCGSCFRFTLPKALETDDTGVTT